MSKSSLTLIAGSSKTKEALQEQLEQLLGDYVHVSSLLPMREYLVLWEMVLSCIHQMQLMIRKWE